MSLAEATVSIALPQADGSLRTHTLGLPGVFTRPGRPLESRVFLAAAHVVPDPLREPDGSGRAQLDWDATLAFRRHLWPQHAVLQAVARRLILQVRRQSWAAHQRIRIFLRVSSFGDSRRLIARLSVCRISPKTE